MIRHITQFPRRYVNSFWIPAAVMLPALIAFGLIGPATTLRPYHPWLDIGSKGCLAALGLSLLGTLGAGIWNLQKRRWVKGLINLAAVLAGALATAVVFAIMVFAPFFGPGKDHFADHLSIPADLTVAEPLTDTPTPLPATTPSASPDGFQQCLIQALHRPGRSDPTITATVNSLAQLGQTAPDVLKRYLATSPAWRVYGQGAHFATRRWYLNARWRYTMNGYYTRGNLDQWANQPNFQSRTTIGLSGQPLAQSWFGGKDTTRLRAGASLPLKLATANQLYQSRCVITAGNLLLELFEQSPARERCLTQATLNYLNQELMPLAKNPTWPTIQAILPPDSIRSGKPSFELHHSFQPGIYDTDIWINPGEPGMIYLRAWELTRGTPLSAKRLKEASSEWVGWSDDPAQLFFSNTNITVLEGDWGKPYAARFELWFAPDSGQPDRKLMETIFKIEGWQR